MPTAHNRNTLYGRLPPNKVAELKPWYAVHVDLIGLYRKYIIQQHTGGAIIKNNVGLTCTTMINSNISCFEIVKVPMYDLFEVTGCNY